MKRRKKTSEEKAGEGLAIAGVLGLMTIPIFLLYMWAKSNMSKNPTSL